MRTVYKYPLSWGRTLLALPADAKALTVGMQGDELMLWVELDPMADNVEPRRDFRVIATGDEVREGDTYVGTVFEGKFVWHVYEGAS